jgi:hypothetical protein
MLVYENEDEIEAVWVDGYLPNLEELRDLAINKLGDEFKKSDEKVGFLRDQWPNEKDRWIYEWQQQYTRDGVFIQLLRSYSAPSQYRDIFYFYPRMCLNVADWKQPKAIANEIFIDKRQRDYRIPIIVYYTYEERSVIDPTPEAGRLYVTKALEECHFKPKNSYQNPIDFERESRDILHMVLEPYAVPCHVAQAFLLERGFVGGLTTGGPPDGWEERQA